MVTPEQVLRHYAVRVEDPPDLAINAETQRATERLYKDGLLRRLDFIGLVPRKFASVTGGSYRGQLYEITRQGREVAAVFVAADYRERVAG